MGPGDKPAPPPFKALHGTGVLFRSHWRIAGLSGAPKLGPGAEGLYLTESDSEAILMPLPAADIFLSYSPSSDLEFSNINTHQGFDTLGKYLSARPPIYHFYAHPNESIAEDRGEYLAIGVCGKLICDGQNDERPSLPYF